MSIKCHYVECRYGECCYAEFHYAECLYTECRYAECHYSECHGADELSDEHQGKQCRLRQGFLSVGKMTRRRNGVVPKLSGVL